MRQVLERISNERITFVGNKADVVPWLQAFDVFALPSYANEGVPQALAQAMLAGLPCVTTNVGGIGELARDGETALVVPPQDPKALRSALQRLLGDGPLREKLGAAARRHAAANFSLEGMLARMETIYRQVGGQR
jgi:glycosyltransferase involved in cell wall biosynthesis